MEYGLYATGIMREGRDKFESDEHTQVADPYPYPYFQLITHCHFDLFVGVAFKRCFNIVAPAHWTLSEKVKIILVHLKIKIKKKDSNAKCTDTCTEVTYHGCVDFWLPTLVQICKKSNRGWIICIAT